MTQHTQGPWVNRNGWVESNDGYWICLLPSKNDGLDQSFFLTDNANSNLILAAPDMFAALAELVAMNNTNYTIENMQAAFNKAQAAINKAKGL